MGPLPRGRLLNVYVLVIVDQLTRYLIAVPTRDRSADTVINVLQDRVFRVYNVPKLILSDNAREFTGDAMSQMANIMESNLRPQRLIIRKEMVWMRGL